ncbi:hypothetical protein GUJ93_ZPchr0002g23285 [Zizania palustris]|uniref:RING-type E3 ubiquitin transferase n=1 Tax=Zizania palustris TaxID=103762 RepID=A0A8J5SPN7_ZIZPA|nr:hypothetical protein GUJ93_ZPchr0002g23285 [Zizania palustris]
MRALLHSTAGANLPSSPPAAAISIDSDMVVILASLLCALICVAGLALVARCACRRTRRAVTIAGATPASASNAASAPAPKGLKKKAIDALPTVSFVAGASGKQQLPVECAICLAEFAAGEAVRVLPHCGHDFHVACIDTWLGTHATCPSCRSTVGTPPTLFLPGRCRRCGEVDDVAQLEAAHFSSSSAAAAGDDDHT